MRRRRYLALTGGILGVSGCAETLTPGPTAANLRVELDAQTGPALVFDYSVDDYAPVLLEGPNGRIISDGQLEPDHESDSLSMGVPGPGTYTVIIQRGGETAATASVSFDGPDPELLGISSHWTKNILEEITPTVENAGDLPLLLKESSYSVGGQHREAPILEWIPAEDRGAVTVGQFQPIRVSESGTVQGSMTIQTSAGILTGEFSHEIPGPDSVIQITDTQFLAFFGSDEADLLSVTIQVRNEGGSPLQYDAVSVSLDGAARVISFDQDREVAPGRSRVEYVSPELTVDTGTVSLSVELLMDLRVVGETTVEVEAG